MTGYDPQMRAALDQFTVPPLRAGLAGEIVRAAVDERPAPTLRSRTAPAVRNRGGVWRRGRTLLGVSALLLASATAAAAGLFGPPVRLPVVSDVIAAIAPDAVAPRAMLQPKRAPVREMAAAPAAASTPDAAAVPVAIEPARAPRAERAQGWLAVRQAREAAGLPVRPLPARAQARLERAVRNRGLVAEHPQVAARIVEQSRFATEHPAVAARVAERLRGPAVEVPAAAEPRQRDLHDPADLPDLRSEPSRQPATDTATAEATPAAAARGAGLERLRTLRQLREQRRALRQLRRH